MIIDITGIELTLGNGGINCLGNVTNGGIKCYCDECDYLLCCTGVGFPYSCLECDDFKCPRH